MQLILAAVLLILGIADYAKGKNAMNSLQYAKPSEMVCPDCGNTHIFINRMQTGTVNTSTCSGTAYGAGHIAFGSGTAKGMAMMVISIVTGIIAAVLVHMQEKERRSKLK